MYPLAQISEADDLYLKYVSEISHVTLQLHEAGI